jgi:nucleoside-diphosphate-sugar epimerase
MRVVITGPNGFIGHALTRALQVRGISWQGATRETVGDIGATTCWGVALKDCDHVVHLANLAHVGNMSEVPLRAVNVEGSRRLAEQAAAAGVRRFIYVSSAKAAEADDAYGRTKLAAERALKGIAGLEVVVLRPPLVYGPGVKANFLALMRAVDGGWPLPLASVRNGRSLVYVGNLVDAIIRCLEAPEAAGRTYFVTDGEPVSTPKLVRALALQLRRPARLFAIPPVLLEAAGALVGRIDTVRRLTRSLEVDDSAIRRELGWAPPFTFEEGIRLTCEWYRAQRTQPS